jgi:hypothetical protein
MFDDTALPPPLIVFVLCSLVVPTDRRTRCIDAVFGRCRLAP